jgi:molybdopterin-guanine dinucleotide biosynthesis protein A
MRSALVLVGGEAKRANGSEKYFFMFNGKTFIERLINSLSKVVDEIILVARDPEQCRRFDHIEGVRCITDQRPGLGPIGGLHAGARAATGELVFVSACDMPCIDYRIVSYLFDRIDGYDAAIPQWNEQMLEPLHAVYRREALVAYLESHDSLSLRQMVWSLNTRYVPVEELRSLDTDLITFTNINKLDELDLINTEKPGILRALNERRQE